MSVGKVQRVPRGFLQFLGMVGSGITPTQMGDDIRATVDMTPFLGATLLGTLQVNDAAMQLVGDVVSAPVPAGEGWYLLGATYGIVAQAIGDSASCRLRIIDPRTGNQPGIDNFAQPKTAVAATAALVQSVLFPQPLILLPGNELQMVIDDSNLPAVRIGFVAGIFYRFET